MKGQHGPYWVLEESYWDPQSRKTKTRLKKYYGKEHRIPPEIIEKYGQQNSSIKNTLPAVNSPSLTCREQSQILAINTPQGEKQSRIKNHPPKSEIECTVPKDEAEKKEELKRFIHDLYSKHYGDTYRERWNIPKKRSLE